MILYIVICLLLLASLSFGLIERPALGGFGSLDNLSGKPARWTVPILIALLVVFGMWYLTANRAIGIGQDTANYVDYFLYFSDDPNASSRIEFAYRYYCFFVAQITDDPHMFLFITATIMYGLLAVYLVKYCDNILASACLAFCFCFALFMSALRQDFAMLICMFAFQQLKKERKVAFVLLVVFAALFHKSALVCLLLLLARLIPANPLAVTGLCFSTAFLSASGILGGLLRVVAGPYAGYFSGQYASSGWLAISVYLVEYALFYVVVYCALAEGEKNRRLILANFFLLEFLTSFGFAVNLFSRLAEYFLLISVSELPNALCGSNLKNRKELLFLLGAVLLSYFLVQLWLRPNWNNIIPFAFWS